MDNLTFYKYHLAKFILIAFIFFNSIQLFAQNPPRPSFELEETLYFKRVEGVYKINSSDNDKITGELISIKLNQDLNPMTGFTSEVVFKPSKKPLISPLLVGGTLNDEEYYIFNAKDIDKIEIKVIGKSSRISKKIVIYSDQIQKEYSSRKEINKIVDAEVEELYRYLIKRDQISQDYEKVNRVVNNIVLYTIAGCVIIQMLVLSLL